MNVQISPQVLCMHGSLRPGSFPTAPPVPEPHSGSSFSAKPLSQTCSPKPQQHPPCKAPPAGRLSKGSHGPTLGPHWLHLKSRENISKGSHSRLEDHTVEQNLLRGPQLRAAMQEESLSSLHPWRRWGLSGLSDSSSGRKDLASLCSPDVIQDSAQWH